MSQQSLQTFFPSIWSLSFPWLNGVATTAQALNTKGNSKASLKKEQCSDASVNMVSERCPNTAHGFINEGYAATSSRKINTYSCRPTACPGTVVCADPRQRSDHLLLTLSVCRRPEVSRRGRAALRHEVGQKLIAKVVARKGSQASNLAATRKCGQCAPRVEKLHVAT